MLFPTSRLAKASVGGEVGPPPLVGLGVLCVVVVGMLLDVAVRRGPERGDSSGRAEWMLS